MFSPHDSPAVKDWFQRFDAASRHLPAEERAVQRQEIQQHLEALVVAHEELGTPPAEAWRLALTQFGNPTKIGRKIGEEWQQGRTGPSADKHAIQYATGHIGCYIAYFIFFCWLRNLWLNGGHFVPLPAAVYLIYVFGGTIPVGVLIGRTRPLQAIRVVLYASLLYACQFEFYLVTNSSEVRAAFLHTYPSLTVHLLLLTWVLGQTAIAYLASVTKRGWYKPTLADFKLTLPRRRPQISR